MPALCYGAHPLRFWLTLFYSKRLKTLCLVGIIGSAGNTTAKNLSASIFRSAGEYFSTLGFLNYPGGIEKLLFGGNSRTSFAFSKCSGGNLGKLDRPF